MQYENEFEKQNNCQQGGPTQATGEKGENGVP